MLKKAMFVPFCVLFSVAIFSGCIAAEIDKPPNSSSEKEIDLTTKSSSSMSAQALENMPIAASAAADFAKSIVADIKSGVEPVQGEYNNGQSVLDAYQLFVKPETLESGDPVFSYGPDDLQTDFYAFTCDVHGKSAISGQHFDDQLNLYIRIDPATHEVKEKSWNTLHIYEVYNSDEAAKLFFDCAMKNDPKRYSQVFGDGGWEPSQDDLNHFQKNMTYYTQKYDLSSYTMIPTGISADNSFFIKYNVTDAKGTVFEIKTGRGDGMFYMILPVECD